MDILLVLTDSPHLVSSPDCSPLAMRGNGLATTEWFLWQEAEDSQSRNDQSDYSISQVDVICLMTVTIRMTFSDVNTLPVENNLGWIHPQCGIIESHIIACRVFFSRLLYVPWACNLLVSSVKTNVSLPINHWLFLLTGSLGIHNVWSKKWTHDRRSPLVATKQSVMCLLRTCFSI